MFFFFFSPVFLPLFIAVHTSPTVVTVVIFKFMAVLPTVVKYRTMVVMSNKLVVTLILVMVVPSCMKQDMVFRHPVVKL